MDIRNDGKRYAIRIKEEDGLWYFFIGWDNSSGCSIYHRQIDLDESIKLFDEEEAKAALDEFQSFCRAKRFPFKSKIVDVFKEDVVIGLMTFEVDKDKAEAFKKELTDRLDQIDYVNIGLGIKGMTRNMRSNAIKEVCAKYKAKIE